MQITFVSNYINHHQIPFCERLAARFGTVTQESGEDAGASGFVFIQTEPMEAERTAMGWEERLPDYVWLSYGRAEWEAQCRTRIFDSDVVLFGGCEEEGYIAPRLAAGRFTIRYSERVYKDGQWKCVTPRGLLRKYKDHTRYRSAPVYLLCAGAYTASDYRIFRAYPGKMYRWGYFPEFRTRDLDALIEGKRANEVPLILWAGRFLGWKRAWIALDCADYLKRRGLKFRMELAGSGELEGELLEACRTRELTDVVTFLGALSPDEVRERMDAADIFLVTSDRREGWGAVVSEAMSSACAVIADADEGAVPYLLRNGYNGCVYSVREQRGTDGLCEHAERLLSDAQLREELGRNAYRTIEGGWNPEAAAEGFLLLVNRLRAIWGLRDGMHGQPDKAAIAAVRGGRAGSTAKPALRFPIPAPASLEMPRRERDIRREALRG